MIKRSINIRLPMQQITIVVITVSALFVLSYVVADRFVVRQKMGDLMNLADAKYVNVLDMLDRNKSLARQQSQNPLIARALATYNKSPTPKSQTEIETELLNIKASGGMKRPHAFGKKPLTRYRYYEVLVTDDKGKIAASTEPSSVGKNLLNNQIRKIGSRRTAVIDPMREQNGQIVVPVVSPIYSRTGGKRKFLGIFVNKIDMRVLTMIMNADLGNILGGKLFFAGFQYRDLDIYMIDKQGRYMTQSRIDKSDTALKKRGSRLPWHRTLDVNTTGDERVTNVGISTGAHEAMDIYENSNGEQVAGASMPIFDQKWTIVVEQPTKEAFAGLIMLERSLVIGGLLAAFLAGLAAWTSTRKITDSLADLGTTSARLADGDLDTKSKTKPKEYLEIASLADSFDAMRFDLKHMIESARRSNEALFKQEALEQRVDDLLEFIKPHRLILEHVSLNNVVNQALETIAIPATISLNKQIDTSLPDIKADRSKTFRALTSIISRAIQVMPDSGSLTVKTTMTTENKDTAGVTVSDTGPAIKSEDLPRVLDPEFMDEAEPGSALPLANILIERQGGRLSVYSHAGIGTTVTIDLPLELKEAA